MKELSATERKVQVRSGCERENHQHIANFVMDEILDSAPAELTRRTKKVTVMVSCGGIALDGSGCKSECVPFVAGTCYDKYDQQLGEFIYVGNCKKCANGETLL